MSSYSYVIEKKSTPHRTGKLPHQNTPKIRTANVWFLGALLPLVLFVFYEEILRIPLEFCYPHTDFPTWKF